MVRENGKLLGVVAWNDMNSVARLSGTIDPKKSFHMDATAIGIYREDRCRRRSIWPRRMDHGQYQGAKCRLQKHPRAVV